MTLRLLFILEDDALSKLGSGTNFKVATVQSRTQVSGTIYGAFPVSSASKYKYVGIDSTGRIVVLDNGVVMSNDYANVIYS